VIATKTSSISTTRLAAPVCRPGRFVGMNSFNPVPVMKFVEVVRGLHTTDDTNETVRASWSIAFCCQ